MRPQSLDAAALTRQARRLAAGEAPPWLHPLVAMRMAERLGFIKLQPQRILDLSAWLGASQDALRAAYPHAELLWHCDEPALAARARQVAERPWWQRLGRTQGPRWLGAVAAPADLVWANFSLHAQLDPLVALSGWSARLAPGGFVMFSSLGPDSFKELRALYAQQAWGRSAPEWWDMHDLGDLMGRAGFADPVLDQERLRLTWAEPEALLKDLRALGGNLAPGRHPGCRTPRWRARLLQALETLRGEDGRLGLTLELVFGHAFKAEARHAVAAETTIGLDAMRASLRAGRGNSGKA